LNEFVVGKRKNIFRTITKLVNTLTIITNWTKKLTIVRSTATQTHNVSCLWFHAHICNTKQILIMI